MKLKFIFCFILIVFSTIGFPLNGQEIDEKNNRFANISFNTTFNYFLELESTNADLNIWLLNSNRFNFSFTMGVAYLKYPNLIDLYPGIGLRINLSKKNQTPFIGFATQIDFYRLNADKSDVLSKFNGWNLSKSFGLNIGYSYRFKESNWGYEVSYNIEVNSFGIDYQIERVGNQNKYVLINPNMGRTYLKFGLNYFF